MATDRVEPLRDDSPVPALSVRGLSKSFGDRQVLKSLDLEIGVGEHVAVIGPSGSGKSTLIRCLNLLETPDSGEIFFKGRPVWGLSVRGRNTARDLRTSVGMVFQSFNLFPTKTALENVSLAQIHTLGRTRDEADRRSTELLAKVGLSDHLNHRPDQLSGGQQQRVAISRALALDPEIMLFDEPTSAIDPEMRVEVLRVMKDLAANDMTMITVTHEFKFAQSAADRVIFFADGVIVEEGTPSQLFGSPQHERTRQFVNAVAGDI